MPTNEKPQPQIPLGDWNLSDEREFMENLLCTRFNFFLVLFSLVLGAAFTTQSVSNRLVILGVGSVVCLLVWLTIYRAHVKHHWIMQYLYKQPTHPAAVVNDAIRSLGKSSLFSVSRLIGIIIPLLCCFILVGLAILTALGWLEPK